jgi:hypothetical protein
VEKSREKFRPSYPPFHQQGYQQLFNSLFERNVDKSNIDSLAPPQDEFLQGNILQRAISVCPLVRPLPDCGKRNPSRRPSHPGSG